VLDVLYEDNHLLAVNKPALLPTMGVADDRPSLLAVAKEYIRHKYHKPGNVYLGIISRLDAPVTGVVLLARTSKAAARLSQQFRERDVEKVYWAIVEGHVEPRVATLTDFVRKDERHRRMRIAGSSTPDAQRAELSYAVLCEDRERERRGEGETRETAILAGSRFILSSHLGPVSLVEVRPLTGRKHQIRVQLAHAGFPIVGDRKYGSQRAFSPGIALHSRRLVVAHPVSKMLIEIEAPPPSAWQRLLERRR
jgi:23S rRNA pseudouridine1911/1915/1917 synthase